MLQHSYDNIETAWLLYGELRVTGSEPAKLRQSQPAEF